MATQKHELEISADPRYPNAEIDALVHEFERAFLVRRKKYERFGASELPLILVITFGLIASGFFEEIGKDIWQSLKDKLVSTVSKHNEISEVGFNYNYKSKTVELRVKSADPKVIASAFDHIQQSLEIIERSQQNSVYLEFVPHKNEWQNQMIGGQKVALRFVGVLATTNRVDVRGRSYQLSEEGLRKGAKQMPGKAIGWGHGGPRIGVIEDAWYEDGKLMGRGAVFEPRDERGRQILESIKRGETKGLSVSFSFDSENE